MLTNRERANGRHNAICTPHILRRILGSKVSGNKFHFTDNPALIEVVRQDSQDHFTPDNMLRFRWSFSLETTKNSYNARDNKCKSKAFWKK